VVSKSAGGYPRHLGRMVARPSGMKPTGCSLLLRLLLLLLATLPISVPGATAASCPAPLEPGVGFGGPGIRVSFLLDSLALCCAACSANATWCRGFTFHGEATPSFCDLRDTAPSSRKSGNPRQKISAEMPHPSPPPPVPAGSQKNIIFIVTDGALVAARASHILPSHPFLPMPSSPIPYPGLLPSNHPSVCEIDVYTTRGLGGGEGEGGERTT